eukprot:2284162-Amphidinium_carterae.1
MRLPFVVRASLERSMHQLAALYEGHRVDAIWNVLSTCVLNACKQHFMGVPAKRKSWLNASTYEYMQETRAMKQQMCLDMGLQGRPLADHVNLQVLLDRERRGRNLVRADNKVWLNSLANTLQDLLQSNRPREVWQTAR